MTERPWAWYAGSDEERYNIGPCATKQDAIDEMLADQSYKENEPEDGQDWTISFYVIEATKHGIDDITIDGERILEELTDNQCEDWLDPDGDGLLFPNLTPEDQKDLNARLTAAFREWARDKHVSTWSFRDTRNAEHVVLPHPAPPEPPQE